MPLDAMEKIKTAESQADNIRKTAQQEAREIIKTTEDAIRAGERESNLDIREKVAAYLREQDELIDAQVGQLQRGGEAARQEMAQSARKNLGKASAFIYGRIINNG